MRCISLVPVGLLVLLVVGVLAGLFIHMPLSQVFSTLTSAEIRFALGLTLMTSGAATAISVFLGVPSGHFLARRAFRGKILIDTLIDLPMTMTPLVAGVGLLFLLGSDTVRYSLDRLGIELLFTPWGAVLAQTLIAAPIMTRTSRAAFAAVDTRYENAAQTLGLKPGQVFIRVALPMARPVLLSGAVLCWARAVGEFGATLMVAGATRFRTETLPIAVYLNISSGELGIALVCAMVADHDRVSGAAGPAPDRGSAFERTIHAGDRPVTTIRLERVSARVLDKIDLMIAEGELFVLLGPSGGGKSTLLQVIAGLLPCTGHIFFNDERIDGLPPHKRRVGYLFQDLLLFPHLTVRKNLLLAMTHLKIKRRTALERTEELLQRFGIPTLADRYPARMSGGEKQRAALARAIAADPHILLLDEPFSSLDEENARRLRMELRSHQRNLHITTLFVTHNHEEARLLGDRIGVIRSGRLYNHPGFEDVGSMGTITGVEPEAAFPASVCFEDSDFR